MHSFRKIKRNDAQILQRNSKSSVKKYKWLNAVKMLYGNNLAHELSLKTRQKTKPRNAFNNNISTDLTLSKAQISKVI